MIARPLQLTLALASFSIASVSLATMPRAEPSAAETIYASLATLSPTERQERLVEGAKKEGKLIFVHTWLNNLPKEYVALFKKAYPFLDIDFNSMETQSAAERFVEEETASRHLTDLWSLAVYDLQAILDHDFAARYPTPATDAIPPRYRRFIDLQNRWTPYYLSDFGISYNPRLVAPDEAPKSWFDLCKPQFKGNVSFDTVSVRFLVGIDAMMGDEKMRQWLECIGKNDPIVQQGLDQRFQLMLAGDHAVQGHNYTYYCYAAKAKNPEVPCTVVTTAPLIGLAGTMVINRNAQHPYAAALMTDWSLSQDSQEYAAKNFRGPLALKHPYLPDDAQIVVAPIPDKAEVDKVLGYWKKYIGK